MSNLALKLEEDHDCHAGPEDGCDHPSHQPKDLNQSPDSLEPKAVWCAECDKPFPVKEVIEHDDAFFCSDSCVEEWDLQGIEEARELVSEYRAGCL